MSAPRAKFHIYRGNVSPLWGKKPIFGPLSKNNTGMAALCAGLPVITYVTCRNEFLPHDGMAVMFVCLSVYHRQELCKTVEHIIKHLPWY